MRKFIAIVFLLVYANVGLAMVINFHFCSGHLSKISLAEINFHSSCCCKTKSMGSDCCKDETVLVKAENHQAQAVQEMPDSGFKILPLTTLIPLTNGLFNFDTEKMAYSLFFRKRSPLPNDIFLTTRNLRI